MKTSLKIEITRKGGQNYKSEETEKIRENTWTFKRRESEWERECVCGSKCRVRIITLILIVSHTRTYSGMITGRGCIETARPTAYNNRVATIIHPLCHTSRVVPAALRIDFTPLFRSVVHNNPTLYTCRSAPPLFGTKYRRKKSVGKKISRADY